MTSTPYTVSFWTFAGPGIAGSLAMILTDSALRVLAPKTAQGFGGNLTRITAFWGIASATWWAIHHHNGATIT